MTRRAASLVRQLLLVPVFGAAALLSACGTDSTAPDIPSNPAVEVYNATLGVNIAAMTKKSDNLFVQDIVAGTGAEAVAGDSISVKYAGFLTNGSGFDSGVFAFKLGVGRVIPGWDQGVVGMKVGGKRKLVIGSVLGYGREGSRPIPPNATLVFDVEYLRKF